MNKSAIILIIVISIFFILGAVQIARDYALNSITGEVISSDFNIEEVSIAQSPSIAALLNTVDNKLVSQELDGVLEKDGIFVVVKPTTIPARRNDHKFYMEWDRKIMVLALYMRKEGADSSFEIWGGNNKKIASGELGDDYRWYYFDVSSNEMSSEGYALFNYGGGSADIYVDQVLSVPYPEGGLSRVTGLISTST